MLLAAESKKVSKNRMILVNETEVVFGKPESFPSFGWDVEYGTTRLKYVHVGPTLRHQLAAMIAELLIIIICKFHFTKYS